MLPCRNAPRYEPCIVMQNRPSALGVRSAFFCSLEAIAASIGDYSDLKRSRPQCSRLVGGFPCEFRLFAAEMAVSGGFVIERAQQVKHLPNALRTQVEMLGDQLRQLFVADLAGAESGH